VSTHSLLEAQLRQHSLKHTVTRRLETNQRFFPLQTQTAEKLLVGMLKKMGGGWKEPVQG